MFTTYHSSSSVFMLTTYRSMCLATEGRTVLWGHIKCGPKVHWLTDHEEEIEGDLYYDAHRMGIVTGTATE
jgi:hypothetical protein